MLLYISKYDDLVEWTHILDMLNNWQSFTDTVDLAIVRVSHLQHHNQTWPIVNIAEFDVTNPNAIQPISTISVADHGGLF